MLGSSYLSCGAYSEEKAGLFSFTVNPAALAEVKEITAGIYAERKFLIESLNSYEAAASSMTSSGAFGLQFSMDGYGGYKKSRMGLAYARKLGNNADAGVQFNYNTIKLTGYGSASTISFRVGCLFHINGQWHTGIAVDNPVGGKFGNRQMESLPAIYSMGLGYDLSKEFYGTIEIVKEELQPVSINPGIQYKPDPRLQLSAGVLSGTSSFWIGAGILWSWFRFDIIIHYHAELGLSPGLLFLILPKKKKE